MNIITNYVISGMTCHNCVRHVTEEMKNIPGVLEVEVEINGPMKVVSTKEIDFSAVKAAVDEAGNYTVAPA